MKLFFSIILIATVVYAEPPRRFSRFFARQETAPPAPEAPAAPYPPSGWKPSGQEFRLPARQQQIPSTVYGPPPASYGPPPEYGPPDVPTTTEAESENVTTEVPDAEGNTESSRLTKARKTERLQEEKGVYYIYHPNGFLQKVIYSTKNDLQNMAYTAQIRYTDVEPIRDPVFTYDPVSFTYRQIQL